MGIFRDIKTPAKQECNHKWLRSRIAIKNGCKYIKMKYIICYNKMSKLIENCIM